MDNLKDKYFMRLFLSLASFACVFALIFFCIYDEITWFVTVPLILLDIVLLFIVYQSFCYRLALRKKHEIVLEEKINLEELMKKRIENKEKRTKMIDLVFNYSLYASPIIIIMCIALGIFVANSVILGIVLPAFIITYLVTLFFVKDIYAAQDIIEEKELKENFIINKKSVVYMGKVYLINDAGFYFKDNQYKFLFIPLARVTLKDDLKEKFEGAINEIRNK